MELICSNVTHSELCDERSERKERDECGAGDEDCHCEVVCGHYR